MKKNIWMKRGKRAFAAAMGMTMICTMVGCGNNKTKTEADVPTVTIWSSGGQEVREALQEIADAYNSNEEYSKVAKVEIQFVVSGTSEQSLPDRLSAAYKAGEKDTDFDLIAIDDSAIANIEAQTSEDFFEDIDVSKIPNYDNLIFKDNIVGENFIPYRGTSVYLAYNSETVKTHRKQQKNYISGLRNTQEDLLIMIQQQEIQDSHLLQIQFTISFRKKQQHHLMKSGRLNILKSGTMGLHYWKNFIRIFIRQQARYSIR